MIKRNNISIFKYIFAIIIALTIFSPVVKVEAQTLNDMYNELATLKKKKAEINSQKKLTEDEIYNLNNDISSISEQIENARSEVIQAEKDIETSEQKIEDKKEESKELLKFLQLSTGENVYLDYILASEDYTDFVYRYSVVSQLTAYNNQLINELENLIEELKQKKIELSAKQTELDSKRKKMSNSIK